MPPHSFASGNTLFKTFVCHSQDIDQELFSAFSKKAAIWCLSKNDGIFPAALTAVSHAATDKVPLGLLPHVSVSTCLRSLSEIVFSFVLVFEPCCSMNRSASTVNIVLRSSFNTGFKAGACGRAAGETSRGMVFWEAARCTGQQQPEPAGRRLPMENVRCRPLRRPV